MGRDAARIAAAEHSFKGASHTLDAILNQVTGPR
jgi:hypothetical protein